jgi:pre-mRNA cleavage complex 2 protein Pcf11
MKLPAFYLLDAVSKNVFEPYARNFTPLVVPLFLDTYGQVDQSTRNKMEEMLLTWRTGAPNGRELFGVVAQLAIEQGIWGSGSSSVSSRQDLKSHVLTLQQSGDQATISKSQVLSELEFTVSQKERALQANPYDTLSSTQLPVLYQVRDLFSFIYE